MTTDLDRSALEAAFRRGGMHSKGLKNTTPTSPLAPEESQYAAAIRAVPTKGIQAIGRLSTSRASPRISKSVIAPVARKITFPASGATGAMAKAATKLERSKVAERL
jgi:hypothetical protein